MENMTGTFIDLSRCRHPAGCPCSDCTALKQLDTPSILDSMESLRSNLPGPGKTTGWIVPERPSLRRIACREIQILGDERFTVGREHTCNLVLEEFMFDSDDDNLQWNKTSRVQFEIICEAERLFILDKSMNGSFLNGERLRGGVAKRLNHGDTISILQQHFELFCYLDEYQMMRKNYPLRIITKYLVGNIVGSGAYAVVRKGFTRSTFTPVAMKFIKKNQLPSFYGWMAGDNDAARKEVNILQQLHHPCITKVLDVVETTFELVIVMEYAEGGDLERQVKMDSVMGRLSETTAKFQFYQICHTIAYLHSKQICHRDLKLANILLMESGPLALLKVSDFGVSKVWSSTSVLESMVGTPAFMAPEVWALRSTPHTSYTCKSDCWSLGVVLHCLLSGQQPSHSQLQISYENMMGEAWDSVSKAAKDLVMRLLSVEPEQRPSSAEILRHPWFTEDDTTCSQARNKMFGTRDSVVGSDATSGIGVSVTSSGLLSKDGSKQDDKHWRKTTEDKSCGEAVIENIRARLRSRATTGRGVESEQKGSKRKEELIQGSFLLPMKRRRRVSESPKQQIGVGEDGGNIKARKRRRRRTGN